MAELRAAGAEIQRQFEDLVSRFMASDAGQRMIGWYETLGARDRLALRSLGGFVGAVLLYLLLIGPMIEYGNRAQHRLSDEHALLEWLRSHQSEAGSGSGNAPTRDQPVATVVNTSAQENKLTIRRYEPAGEDGIKVWIEGAAFNSIVKWMYQLEGTYGIHAAEFTLEREDGTGKVNARLTLRG